MIWMVIQSGVIMIHPFWLVTFVLIIQTHNFLMWCDHVFIFRIYTMHVFGFDILSCLILCFFLCYQIDLKREEEEAKGIAQEVRPIQVIRFQSCTKRLAKFWILVCLEMLCYSWSKGGSTWDGKPNNRVKKAAAAVHRAQHGRAITFIYYLFVYFLSSEPRSSTIGRYNSRGAALKLGLIRREGNEEGSLSILRSRIDDIEWDILNDNK